MLVLVQAVFLLRFAHTHPGLDIDIVIDTIHIGERMVNDIVFHIPHEAVASQDIQGKSSKMIHPFVFRKTTMRPVMHHVKSDRRDNPAQQHTFQYRPENGRSKKYQVDIDQLKAHHQYHRLQKDLGIPRSGLSNLFEIIADPLLQFRMKGMGTVRKFGHCN
jgi:hypothetical protein